MAKSAAPGQPISGVHCVTENTKFEMSRSASNWAVSKPAPPPKKGGGGVLTVVMAGREPYKLSAESMLIGRGKHCDFVINSGKVSREHAVIIRDGGDYYIEDLGSSNGTWFNKQRIKRRKIEDGDEYFICSEKVKLVFR